MTDITELAQSLKAAAVRAKTATEEYASGHMPISVCFAECEEFNRLTDGPDNIIALVEALEKALEKALQPVVPNEITSASAPEVFEVAAEAERLGLRGTYASYAVGWNACRTAMLAAAQQEVQVVPKKIEQSRKRVDRCDVCTEGARGGCGTCIFNGNFE
ncbi:hypothetical protein [Klebsiella quasipneumoniae]|uniref:hypothetical protein n=1 Tax=Klebsiella quasipneumoniae TaxID=1463165 RepID=UPI0021CD18A5|nr:hypothetical protein [Klebsiella quasipneumoniae]